jgi:DNA-binding beta-propeller fold protein YncE
VKPTEHIAKPASTPKTGLFAMLCAFLHVKGSGAPEITHAVNRVQPHPTAGKLTDRRSPHALLRSWTVAPILAFAALAFTTAPALAAGAGHVFSSSFKGTPGHELSGPSGIAVNNATGNVYVVNKGNSRVVEFNPTGTEVIAEFGTSGELSEPEAIAIDNSGETAAEDPSLGDVYVTSHVEVAGEHKGVVDKFEANGTYLGQVTTGEGGAPLEEMDGVAVDPKGQLWVYQKNAQIDAFSDARSINVFVSSVPSPASSPPDPGFAVNSEDDLYVAHSGEPKIAKLNSKGEELESELGGGEGKTGVAVEAASNNVYIDSGNPEEGSPKIQEFTSAGAPIEAFGEEEQLADKGGTALAVSYANVSSGDVYVVDSTAGKVDIFTPPRATVHAYSFSFGDKGTGSGELTEPSGIAVNDETEDVYVVDKGNKRVEEFSKSGSFIAAFAPSGGFENPEYIAIDNSGGISTGDVYVADNGNTHVIDKFNSTGAYEGQLTGTCPWTNHETETVAAGTCEPSNTAVAPFEGIEGLAVDSDGNIWVNTGYNYYSGGFYVLAEFGDAGGSFLGAFDSGDAALTETVCDEQTAPGLAVDSGDNVYTVCDGGYVVKADPFTDEKLAYFGDLASALAIDPSTGDLFTDTKSSIAEYAPVTEAHPSPLETFSAGLGSFESQGIAVSPADTVYATERATGSVEVFYTYPLAQVSVGAVSNLRPTSVTLEGSVNPEGEKVSSCEFEYGTTTSYGQTAECEPAAGSLGEGTEPVLVAAKVSGLASGTTYHYRLLAGDAHGTDPSEDHTVTTPGPTISQELVSSVEASAATLQATIDPNGVPTSYHFEYDTSPYTSGAAHGTRVPIPNTSIGAGSSAVSVSVRLTGLESGTAYYYRVVAEGEPLGVLEAFDGVNKTFATPTSGSAGGRGSETCPNEQRRAEQPFGLGLPDCRAYEMVSPVQTGGQDATDPAPLVNANARAAESSVNAAITYASKGSFGSPTGAASTGQFVSRRNAEKGLWETQSITPLHDPEKTTTNSSFESTLFTPDLTAGLALTSAQLGEAPSLNGNFGIYLEQFSGGTYRYISQTAAAGANIGQPWGASTDLDRVVLTNPENGYLFEAVDGTDVPVSVTNAGNEVSASVGSAQYFIGEKDAWHATSADGSRVYFTTPPDVGNGVGRLFVRVNIGQKQDEKLGPKEECLEPAQACTIEVSASQREPEDSNGLQPARYWGASADGGKVFYTSNSELTDKAYTGPADNAANLYEYDLATGKLTDLTGEETDATGEGAAVQGVVQISEDGSYVYFVAKGKLAGGATAGQPNLYVSHEGGAPTFIATLDKGDESDWYGGKVTDESGPEVNTAVVDPSGTRLAFISERSLTGYDNQQAISGECEGEGYGGIGESEAGRCREVFLYDAGSAGAGSLACASCNPTGARPVGPSSFGRPLEGFVQYRPRDLLEDGTLRRRVFRLREQTVEAGHGRQHRHLGCAQRWRVPGGARGAVVRQRRFL